METKQSSFFDELKQYAFPIYDQFDAGHRRQHALDVIDASMELAKGFDVDVEMVFVAALYHDLGLQQGRELHHIVSAQILRNDPRITSHFSAEQVEIIAQAIEDHRASSATPPRSLYGRILASADRVIDMDTIILRSFYHSQKHSPELALHLHIHRTYDHILEKYGTGGYLTIPILTKQNEEALSRLRTLLEDKPSFGLYMRHVLHRNGAIKRLFVDMDGVLVDFNAGLDSLDERTKEEYKGCLYNVPHVFSRMLPLPEAVESYRYLASKFDTYILTTAPWDNPTALDDKKAWIKTYLGGVASARLITTHHKHFLRGDFLIDDRTLRGAAEFEGEHIHFATERFPDWKSVIDYLDDKA